MSFDHNDRALIERAIKEDRRGDPVVAALAERMGEFVDWWEGQIAAHGGEVPPRLVMEPPATVFDRIAVELAFAAWREERGVSCELVFKDGDPPEGSDR